MPFFFLLTFYISRKKAFRKKNYSGHKTPQKEKYIDGYKKTLLSVLDLHALLLVAAILVALVCVGELAACGFIFFIATIASYVLYWFTRFMWYVISSPVKDKFKFCGFSREVYDDED